MNTFMYTFFVLWGATIVRNEPDYWPSLLPLGEQIIQYGYPYENHTIHTNDGYILTVGRIPVDPKKCNESKGSVVVQHGVFNNGVAFVFHGPKRSLGFMLADECFDVWLPSTRGTFYSDSHLNYTTKDREFWNFSFVEQAEHDCSAIIDYVLKVTNQSKLHYIGFSIGTTHILLLTSINPSYNKKLISVHLLAPVAHVQTGEVKTLKSLRHTFAITAKVAPELFYFPLPDENYFFKEVLSELFKCSNCSEHKIALIKFAAHFPDRVSALLVMHLLQWKLSGEFQKYDFGREKNQIVYNRPTPPVFDLSKLNVPTYIYDSTADRYATSKDVDLLIKVLPNVVKRVTLVDFEHAEFCFTNKDIVELLNKHIISDINSLREQIVHRKA